eukprot:11019277-Alexandrium_andersonii.AAC.1
MHTSTPGGPIVWYDEAQNTAYMLAGDTKIEASVKFANPDGMLCFSFPGGYIFNTEYPALGLLQESVPKQGGKGKAKAKSTKRGKSKSTKGG